MTIEGRRDLTQPDPSKLKEQAKLTWQQRLIENNCELTAELRNITIKRTLAENLTLLWRLPSLRRNYDFVKPESNSPFASSSSCQQVNCILGM